jgi:hypothetical protein
LLLTGDQQVKISDFGLSVVLRGEQVQILNVQLSHETAMKNGYSG